MPRPTWDEYFARIALDVATRSTCIRPNRAVGAVIVKDKRILATGYNGAPSGLEHCEVVGCLRQQLGIPSGERQEICRGLHAEQNAIIQAALHGVSTKGAVIYVTHTPCITCAKMIINAGIITVYFLGEYPDQMALDMLEEAGITLVKIFVSDDTVGNKKEITYPTILFICDQGHFGSISCGNCGEILAEKDQVNICPKCGVRLVGYRVSSANRGGSDF